MAALVAQSLLLQEQCFACDQTIVEEPAIPMDIRGGGGTWWPTGASTGVWGRAIVITVGGSGRCQDDDG